MKNLGCASALAECLRSFIVDAENTSGASAPDEKHRNTRRKE
jgi:hypothetical protein